LLGVVLAFAGLFLLSGAARSLQEAGSQLSGDLLVFLCAVSFAAHILVTGRYAKSEDPVLLTLVQLGIVAVACAALAVLSAGFKRAPPLSWPGSGEVLLALAVTGVFASALGFYVQTYAQTHAPPTRTAVILTMEPVFAGVFAFLLNGERLGLLGWAGGALILAGMLASELLPGEKRHWVSAEEGTAWVAEEHAGADRAAGGTPEPPGGGSPAGRDSGAGSPPARGDA
jgi:drug/metabolite transporter (DMT)-like permease